MRFKSGDEDSTATVTNLWNCLVLAFIMYKFNHLIPSMNFTHTQSRINDEPATIERRSDEMSIAIIELHCAMIVYNNHSRYGTCGRRR